jgi:hypothetical protein
MRISNARARNRFRTLVYWILAAGIYFNSAAGEAFSPTSVSNLPMFGSVDQTVGWAFAIPVQHGQQVLVTALGVYDERGDGLAGAHPIGLWKNFGDRNSAELLVTATVPAGTAAQLIGDYRYTSITPVILPPGLMAIGSHYRSGSSDLSPRPVTGEFAPELTFLGSAVSLPGPELTVPSAGIPRGAEGLPNYEFFPVNFRYEIVPEPSTWSIAAIALLALVISKRRKSM